MRWCAAAAAAALLLLPIVLAAYQAGPLPGMTGGFGEPTCAQCHAGTRPADGGLALDVPRTYQAGRVYRLRVTLRRANLDVGGFEIAARFAAGDARGRQAGALKAVDGRVQVVTGKGVQYAQHTEAGSRAVRRGAMEWIVEWRAPDSPEGGDVVFHAAANASNGDFSQLGDAILTSESLARAQPSSAPTPGEPYSARITVTGSTLDARRAGR